MEQLRKVGQICRQHYEKLLLSIALLLLGGAVLYLFSESKTQAEIIRKIPVDFEKRTVSTVKPVDLTNAFRALKQAESPQALNFSPPHNLLNPVQWQIPAGSTTPIKKVTGEETGPRSITAVGVRPYHFKLSFIGAASSGAGEQAQVSGYWIGVTNEAVLRATATSRRGTKILFALNVTNITTPVLLTEVKGPPGAPESLAGMLRDTGEKFSIGLDKPFEKVIGYETKLRYPNSTNYVERGAYLRVGPASIDIDGQGYKIVDISTNEVKVVAESNEKPYSIIKFTQ